MEGELHFFEDGTCIGCLRIGRISYEIAGVRSSPIKVKIKARKRGEYKSEQLDIFDDGHGGTGERERDLD